MTKRKYVFNAWHGYLHPDILTLTQWDHEGSWYTKPVEMTDSEFVEFIINTPGNFCTLKPVSPEGIISFGYTQYSTFGQR